METDPGNIFFFVVEICVLCAVETAGIVVSDLLALPSVKRFPFTTSRIRYLVLL